MRKYIIITIILATVTLSGCGSAAATSKEEPAPGIATVTTEEPSIEPASEPASLEDAPAPAAPDEAPAPAAPDEIPAPAAPDENAVIIPDTPPEPENPPSQSINASDYYSADGNEFYLEDYLLDLGYVVEEATCTTGYETGYEHPQTGIHAVYDSSGLAIFFERNGLSYLVRFKTSHYGEDNGGPLMVTSMVESYISPEISDAVIKMARYFIEEDLSTIDVKNLPLSVEYSGNAYNAPFSYDGGNIVPGTEYGVDRFTVNGNY